MEKFNRFPTKANSLAHIESFFNGELKTIIDVGILTGTSALMKTFYNAKHVLIEPVSEFFDDIENTYTKAGIDYDLLKIALSNSQGVQKLAKRVHLPKPGKKYNVTASNLLFADSKPGDTTETVEVETDVLDNIVSKYQGPYLIKIDVDGAEFQILEGMTDTDDIFVIVIESWLSRLGQFMDLFREKGFQLWDITDLCYMRGQLTQVDLIFVNKKVLYKDKYPELTPRNFGHSSGEKGNYFVLTEDKVLCNDHRKNSLLSLQKDGKIL